jgi:hypothetical protein
MLLNEQQAVQIRAKAVKTVTDVLDFYRGDPVYQDVCKGYQPGFGTSCTFLPHWLLTQVGVSAANTSKGVNNLPRGLINRTDAARGTKLVPGDGVSVIANSPAFVKATPGASPQPGDIVIIQSDPYKQPHEHVLVFLSKLSDALWETGESGQARSDAKDGALEGKHKQRAMRVGTRDMIAVAADGKPDRKVRAGSTSRNWTTWPGRFPEPLAASAVPCGLPPAV